MERRLYAIYGVLKRLIVDTDLPGLMRHERLRHRILTDIRSRHSRRGLSPGHGQHGHGVEEPARVLAEVRRVLAPGG
jgi:hypothetical protein